MYSFNGWMRLSSAGYLVLLIALVITTALPAPLFGQLVPRAPIAPLLPQSQATRMPSTQQALWMPPRV